MAGMDDLSILLLSFLISTLTVPVFTIIAVRCGIIDEPGGRKIHSDRIPRLGGLGIILGVFVSVWLFCEMDPLYTYYALANFFIIFIGIYDDSRNVRPVVKLVFQGLAATVVIFLMDTRFEYSLPWLSWMNNGIVMVISTYIWIALVTNAVNLIDGVDGLAGGVAFMAFGSLMVASHLSMDMNHAVCLAFLGGILGFLRYNLPKATVFMGDTGSLFLGFNIAVISLSSSFKTNTIMAVVMPALFVSIPLFDTFLAILRRTFRLQNPMTADREHLHHKLLDLKLTASQTLMIFYTMSIVLSAAALIFFRDPKLYVVLISIFLLYFFLLSIKVLKIASPRRMIEQFNGPERRNRIEKRIERIKGDLFGYRLSLFVIAVCVLISIVTAFAAGIVYAEEWTALLLYMLTLAVLLFYRIRSASRLYYAAMLLFWLFYAAAFYSVSLSTYALTGGALFLLTLPYMLRVTGLFVPYDLLNVFLVILVSQLSDRTIAEDMLTAATAALYYIPLKTAILYAITYKRPEDIKNII
ncbi:UDP-N-acetylmuramyl pentapeptide phosphotransferase/UDP-N-acetylglucosamine-1-phosphate transferase [Seleniivibrio woodruffii]|uniref:UDP-N-acetylmuramyl pentapeptide phosphotransferase/UDP-N-acetylglucosamine-1-phosphate transferase n=2 Tax=Seleniivibrio woodruffii TaxID=1078050 RepID=A0A4R1KC21_9BACT|nr:UDP-N-acetylmuramyl pentapeptide phosphotransferase/UDP-N-acetylglucosamine-1-phosphate transferase [Seleniivibrio woodruffii]TVZ34859.1 UDP-N-acetylmuramyl pentapeptide phosphotransferase/UDP-N-acetylglucosamine-1-phosphate transferase [Seleniivibrio woodruffii]